MALLDDILEWSKALPKWQRDACRRLLQAEDELSGEDFKELYQLLKKEHGIDVDGGVVPEPLEIKHLPSHQTKGISITLVALRNMENVNLISSQNTLDFSEKGMTVIYGDNGSGKSGYARVMKRACRARGQLDKIIPSVYDPEMRSKTPTATFDIKVDKKINSVKWSEDADPPEQLSTISVFDSKCARSYITDEQDVAYLPYGLDIVEDLANKVLPEIRKLLEKEKEGIDIDTSEVEYLCDETEVGQHIGNLSAKSNIGIIKKLSSVSEKEKNRLNELQRIMNEPDPLLKAKELNLSEQRLKAYSEKLGRSLSLVDQKAVDKLKELYDDKNVTELAQKATADILQADDALMSGIGEQVWKNLYNAARIYWADVAHPSEDFPPNAESDLCPLCLEELGDSGIKRFHRFDEYIKSDAAKKSDKALKTFVQEKSKIENESLQVLPDDALAEEIIALDSTLMQKIKAFQNFLNSRKATILKCSENGDWALIPAMIESPKHDIDRIIMDQKSKREEMIKASNEENRKELNKELLEVSARVKLSESIGRVSKIYRNMRHIEKLRACQTALDTRSISSKSKELAGQAVTNELRLALDNEFQSLKLEYIKTKLKKRSEKGKVYYQLVLDIPASEEIEEILSEGEQRAIAIGSFLAELSLADNSSAIVFDDPVSSLDHSHRGKVAERLVKESKRRQVVIFTHEVVFLEQLREGCALNNVEISIASMSRSAEYAGLVNSELPWGQQSIDDRFDRLKKTQRKLAKEPWDPYMSDDLAEKVKSQYSLLRATIERVVQDSFLNRTVRRFSDYVDVKKLKGVVGLQEDDVNELLALNQKCHGIVDAHDPSSAKKDPPPTPEDLGSDISRLEGLVNSIKSQRKGAEKSK